MCTTVLFIINKYVICQISFISNPIIFICWRLNNAQMLDVMSLKCPLEDDLAKLCYELKSESGNNTHLSFENSNLSRLHLLWTSYIFLIKMYKKWKENTFVIIHSNLVSKSWSKFTKTFFRQYDIILIPNT